MEYVADELGVESLEAPGAAARALAARRRGAPSSRCGDPPRAAAGRPPHAHREGGRNRPARRAPRRAGAPAARGRPHLPRPRPQRLLQPTPGAHLPARRARCSRTSTDNARRGQRRGARRPRRASASPARALRRRPVRLRASGLERRRTRTRACGSAPSSALSDETFAIGWAGRLTRDQAAARPGPDAARAARPTASTPRSSLVGDGEDRAATEALAHELGVADHCRFVGYQQRIREWYAAVRRLPADVRERGHAGGRDRGARRRAARRRDAGRRHRHRRRATARAATSSRSATSRRWRSGSPSSPGTRAARAARPGGAADVRVRFARSDGGRARGGLPRPAPVKVLHVHKLKGVSGSEGHLLALLPALRAARRRCPLPRPRRTRQGRAALLRARSTSSASRTAASAAALDVSPRMARDVVRAVRRGAAGPRAHAPRARRRLRARRGRAARACRTSRRATTTTATCSARFATSTALSRAGPAADRDLGRRAAASSSAPATRREARDGPLRPRRAARRRRRSRRRRRPASRRTRRSRSRSAG